MKKVIFHSLFVSVLILLSLGYSQVASAQSRNDRNREARTKRANSDEKNRKTITMPCMMYDDDEWYVATGVSRVLMKDLNTTAINKLLRDCQEQLKTKIKGKYKGVVRDYFDQMDLDAQSSTASHIESAGEMIVDQFLDDTREDCREQDPTPDDAGYINVYMGIMVKKSDLVDKLATRLAQDNNLSLSERELVKKNENKFRESAFKVFEQNKETPLTE